MAWTYQRMGFKNIVVKVGGIIQQTPEVMYFPALLQAGIDRIVNRGYSSADYTLTGNSNSTPDNYYDTIGCVPYIGDFDFYKWLGMISVNGTIEIWNSIVGEAFKLIFTKTDRNVALVSARYGSAVSSNAFYLNLPYNDSESYVVDPVSGFGFAFDIPNYAARPVILSIRAYKLGETVNESKYVQSGPEIYNNFRNPFSVAAYAIFSEVYVPPTPAPDQPYGDDDYDQSEGGNGNHDDTSDVISQDAIPIAAATRTGMCTAYVPDWGEIRDVASALLDPNIFQILAQNVVKFSDVIIGLSVFPCTVPASYTGVVKGNVVGIEIGTGVVCHIADDQYVEINCGDLTVQEYWGNCLDYNPYTKISIFLPFCGTYELDADEIMGKTLNVSYRIDIMSGACLATIKIDGSVFYQYSGQCSAQVPLSSVSFDQFLSSMINLGVATATGVGAIGAAGAGVKEAETAFAATSGSASGGSALMEAREHLSSVKTQSANSIADATVGAVMGSKGFYTHAGAMSGSPGFLGVRTPYLIIKRPEQLIPGMYGKFHGFPCNTTAVLGDLVGYTEVGDIRLNIPDATVEEILECEQLLKGGVVI